MLDFAWLIPVLPLIAYVLIIFLFKGSKALSAGTAIAFMGGSLAIALAVMFAVINGGYTMDNPYEMTVNWLNLSALGDFSDLKIGMGMLLDPLSTTMMAMVSLIALLVTIYSIGYMEGDPGFSRYFAYMSFFVFSMLLLVIADNIFVMFIGWELVGLCSYLLIGFWFHKQSAADAANKAFITNRWGDFGFMLGIILLYLTFGTFNFTELAEIIGSGSVAVSTGMMLLIAILIFFGPMAKSAQFPLHVWLPDAMEGPTPVSSILHAATMVAAGVYLIARSFVIFSAAPDVLIYIAYLGGFTALFAASIALVQRDIKRILAFSTLSQLGYMMMAMGMSAMTAGMFHLTTHAFFKCMLFLCAGSVIHAVHDQDIFNMGGLAKKMPITTTTFVIGALSLSGIFPLSGFWSKDEILLAAFDGGWTPLLIVGTLVAGMTAFYMFRLVFVAFFGKKRTDHHAHENSPVMTVPLIVLAVFAVVAGYLMIQLGYPELVYYEHAHHADLNLVIAGISSVVALGGIFLAYLIYYKNAVDYVALAEKWKPLYNLLYNKFYIDEVYAWLYRRIMLGIAWLCNKCDRKVVDGVADGTGNLVRYTGAWLRFFQNGSLQSYALIFFGAVVIIMILLATPILGGVFK